MHGEDPFVGLTLNTMEETPPYARGRHTPIAEEIISWRNTPVCTGKTLSKSNRGSQIRKHPRMHGEDAPCHQVRRALWETPPYARGRHTALATGYRSKGNTPVCTGKTDRLLQSPVSAEKHPRMHGEDRVLRWILTQTQETPPYARGRQQHYAKKTKIHTTYSYVLNSFLQKFFCY